MIKKLSTAEIDRVLYSECYGRLGCHSRDRTYVVPMTYVFNGASIISHTGLGLKVRMMRENPIVCFEVDCVSDGEWKSVIVYGRFDELHREDARSALQTLLDHLEAVERWQGSAPTHGAGRLTPGREELEVRSAVIFRIHIDEKTGRAETSAARVTA